MNSTSAKNGIPFLLILLSLLQQPAYSTILISPTDSKINYYGRIDFSNPAKPQYNWSGVIIEANFTGSEIGMKIDHSGSFYDIEIDGTPDTSINITTAGEYMFAKKLSGSTHLLRIKLKSEDHYTTAGFLGLLLADGQSLVDPPLKPSRKIEFIGDSYTAGYGIESPGTTCSDEEVKKYTNVFKTFTTQVTKAFHAQNIVLGWSGAGVVRNYGVGTKRSADSYPARYDLTLGAVTGSPKWDFSLWKPDLVVICLGTNDYSTTPHPDDSMYIGDYHKFITRVLGNYPEASILCVSTGDATFEKNLKQVVAEQKTTYNHSKVYFARYPSGLGNNVCHSHPSMNDNMKVAKVLIDTIMKKTGWDTTTTPVEISPDKKQMPHYSVGFDVSQAHGKISITTRLGSPEKIVLLSLDGKKVIQLFTDNNGNCSFLKSTLQGESFVIGNARLGWRKMVTFR